MTHAFIVAASKRAARTAAQVALGAIGTVTLIEQVPWTAVVSTTALATIASLLNSIITGLPETPRQ